jgi:hypothetical protein
MADTPTAFLGFCEKFPQVVKLAYKVADELKDRGVGTYIAREDRQYGRSVGPKLREGIERSHAAVFLWTRSAFDSARVNEELEHAMNVGKPICLVRLGKTPLHPIWAQNDYEYEPMRGVTFLSGILGNTIGPSYFKPRFDTMMGHIAEFVRSSAKGPSPSRLSTGLR